MNQIQINIAALVALADYCEATGHELNIGEAKPIGPDAYLIEVDDVVCNALDDIAFKMGEGATQSDAILSLTQKTS